jgi:hypothetical protein
MSRWILVYQGKPPIPDDALQAVRELPVRVIDQAGRSVLVEATGDGDDLQGAVDKLGNWTLTPEKHDIHMPPPPRPKIKRKPEDA